MAEKASYPEAFETWRENTPQHHEKAILLDILVFTTRRRFYPKIEPKSAEQKILPTLRYAPVVMTAGVGVAARRPPRPRFGHASQSDRVGDCEAR